MLRVVLAVLLLLGLALITTLIPQYDIGWAYPVMIILVPVVAVAALATGIAAAVFHLIGRLERFWQTGAPPNLAFCCLFLAFIAIPPPPVWGAVASVALAFGCGAVVLRQNTGKLGLLLALALPFSGIFPFLSCWAPLASSLLFFSIWVATRWKWHSTFSQK